jgi:hypothetical protein
MRLGGGEASQGFLTQRLLQEQPQLHKPPVAQAQSAPQPQWQEGAGAADLAHALPARLLSR